MGHLFARANLNLEEVEPTRALGFNVLSTIKNRPSFQLPCHLWAGNCTIYDHPCKPGVCSGYKCKILKAIEAEEINIDVALAGVRQAKVMMAEIETLLPSTLPGPSYRQRLVGYVKGLEEKAENSLQAAILRLRAGQLMVFFAKHFGVEDLFDGSGMMKPGDEKA